MKSKFYTQLLKFAATGVINAAIDLAVLNILIAVTHRGHSGAYYSIYKGISFCVAVTNSYLMNRYWTFKESRRRKGVSIEATQFLIVSIIGFGVNVLFASLTVNFVPPMFGLDKFWPSIGALVGTGFGLVWNFIAYKFLVFRHPHIELEPPI